MNIAGYLYFRQNTDGVIIDNFNAPGFDVFKLMIVMHLIFYLPAAFVIMRYSVVKLLLDKISEELPVVLHTAISLGLVGLVTVIVLLLRATGMASGTAFSLVLDLTGGIAGSLTSFILPTAIYLKIIPDDGSWAYKEAQFIYYLGYVIMVAVVAFSIMSVA